MDWWQIKDLMFASGVMLAVLVPIVGLTARFTLWPLIEKFTRARTGDAERLAGDVDQLRRTVDSLRLQIGDIETTVYRLREAEQFERQLRPPTVE